MQILIVDDESRKLKKIKSVMKTISGIAEENITHVLDLNSAKAILSQQEIDLMVLDLNIPEILDESVSNEIAGMEFIDEIINVDKFIKPKDIVIVTEYEGLITKCNALEREILFPIIKYDESSIEWEKILKSKIKYGLVCKASRKCENLYLDFEVAIITAVAIETKAVKRLYAEWETCIKPGDPTIYYTHEININGQKCKIVTAQQTDMGVTAAATLTGKMLRHFRPKYMIMVGIAAGIGKNNNLGDIIVANEVWDYSSGKYVEDESNKELLRFLPEPKYIPLNPQLLGQMSIDFSQQLFEIKNNWIDSINHELKLVIGPLACGNAVIANKKIVDELILAHSRKTVGLDMESYGVFYAVTNGAGAQTIPLCIKSICDFANSSKNDGYQTYAAYTSAAFVKHLIEEKLIYS